MLERNPNPFQCSLISNYISRSGNPHPLASTHNGNNKQRKRGHDCCEPAKRNEEPVLLNPLGDEEGPGEGNGAAEDTDHDETVARQLIIGVDELRSTLK